MTHVNAKTVALTGAASGIGRALALAFAEQGCHLALADLDTPGLEETRNKIRQSSHGAAAITQQNISLHSVNVAEKEQVYDWSESVIEQHGHVDILINNAGVALSGSIEEISVDDFNWVFDIVFYGVLYGTKAFLPHFRHRGAGHIVNISSVNGFFPFPNNSPYNCAKHAVKAFNQTLIQELEGSGIKVTSVHPGGIRTNIVDNSRFVGVNNTEAYRKAASTSFQSMAKTTAEKAAQTIIAGITRDKQRLLVGLDAYILDWLNRLFPQGFSNMVGRAAKRRSAAVTEAASKQSQKPL